MDQITINDSTSKLPYSIIHWQTPMKMKLNMSHDDFCFIVKEAAHGSGIYWGKELEFSPLSTHDLVIIPAGLYYGLSSGMKLVKFKSTRSHQGTANIAPLSPRIHPFQEIHSSYFFSHSDFSLQKLNRDLVLCLSQKSEMTLMLNLANKEMKYFGN